MPRYNVKFNGQWTCFSSVAEGFITNLTKREEYENWRILQYGMSASKLEDANQMTIEEAVNTALLHRSEKEVTEELGKIGLTKAEIFELMQSARKHQKEPNN